MSAREKLARLREHRGPRNEGPEAASRLAAIKRKHNARRSERSTAVRNNVYERLQTISNTTNSSFTLLAVVPEWPLRLRPAYVISIREPRIREMRDRFGPWFQHMQVVAGTNGTHINLENWINEKYTTRYAHLKKGELGCFDSHFRVWDMIKNGPNETALIMEDDVAIRCEPSMPIYLQNAFAELDRLNIQWDIIYLGHNARYEPKARHGNYWTTPAHCQGLFCYLIKRTAAAKLLRSAKPYIKAVDVYVAEMADRGRLKALALRERICYVMPYHSDTSHIY